MKAKATLTDNLRGILFLIASVTCFGIVDGLSKMLIDTQSFGQVVLARYALALPVLLAATHPGKWKSLFQTQMVGWQIVLSPKRRSSFLQARFWFLHFRGGCWANG